MTYPRTGGRILVDDLAAQGCNPSFTVPGTSFLAVLDALHDTPQIDVGSAGRRTARRSWHVPTAR